MEHTKIVTPSELEDFADRRDSEPVIPEIVVSLVNLSVPDLTLERGTRGSGLRVCVYLNIHTAIQLT